MALSDTSGTVLPSTRWNTSRSSIGASLIADRLREGASRTAPRSAADTAPYKGDVADRDRARRRVADDLAERKILEKIADVDFVLLMVQPLFAVCASLASASRCGRNRPQRKVSSRGWCGRRRSRRRFWASAAFSRRVSSSAALARPSSGAARTRALRTHAAVGEGLHAVDRVAPALGRQPQPQRDAALFRAPGPRRVRGSAKACCAMALLRNYRPSNSDHRRKVQPAQGRQDFADRLVERLGEGGERAPYRIDRLRTRVDHVEGDEPGHDEARQ